MSKKIYTKGQEINGLTFLKELELSKTRKRNALFQCFCGMKFKSQIGSVLSRKICSCGCYRIKQLKIRRTTHGLSNHPLHSIWRGIKNRCLNSNYYFFKYYGGRGITICDEWKDNFKSFYDWAILNGYKKDLSIERINNNKGYFPANCTFATMAEQSHNRRSTKLDWIKIKEIRKIKQNNPQILQREIADIYEVTQAAIGDILKNKTWIKQK